MMRVQFLGTQIPYDEGMAIMRQSMADVDSVGPQLLLLEHADVITVTRQHGKKNLLLPENEILSKGIQIIETDRGGDVTFHGAGQLVGYPILRLPQSKGAVDYVRALEEGIIDACKKLGLPDCHIEDGMTGVWIGNSKIAAIGVGLSRGVTRHGFALNIRTNLERFTGCIVPCGLATKGVTSLWRELERQNLRLPTDEFIRQIVAESICLTLAKMCKNDNRSAQHLGVDNGRKNCDATAG